MTYELYPAFKHWMPENGNIWFYSDPHFGDEENWLLRKKFVHDIDNVEAFDNLQIANINKTCGKNDTLVILGDVGDIECVKKLKAKKKILILGNHDRGASYYADVFDEVYTGPVIIAEKLILSHEPIDFPYAVNIHGHDHSNHGFKDGLHINCCTEHINYTPICLSHIVKSGLLKNTTNIHREVVEKAKDRKKKKNKSTSKF